MFFWKAQIRVNAISLGPILTDYHKDKIRKQAHLNNITFEEQLARSSSSFPMNAYGETRDVANLVSFLLSKKSRHINGSNILLDGGVSNAY